MPFLSVNSVIFKAGFHSPEEKHYYAVPHGLSCLPVLYCFLVIIYDNQNL